MVKNKENVTLFNKQVDENDKKIDDGNFGFGIIVLTGGVLLLLNTLGVVSWEVWQYILAFWPVLIILWGIQMLLGKSDLAKIVVGLLTIFSVVIIALFSVRAVNPEFSQNLPQTLNDILDTIEEAKR